MSSYVKIMATPLQLLMFRPTSENSLHGFPTCSHMGIYKPRIIGGCETGITCPRQPVLLTEGLFRVLGFGT